MKNLIKISSLVLVFAVITVSPSKAITSTIDKEKEAISMEVRAGKEYVKVMWEIEDLKSFKNGGFMVEIALVDPGSVNNTDIPHEPLAFVKQNEFGKYVYKFKTPEDGTYSIQISHKNDNDQGYTTVSKFVSIHNNYTVEANNFEPKFRIK